MLCAVFAEVKNSGEDHQAENDESADNDKCLQVLRVFDVAEAEVHSKGEED